MLLFQKSFPECTWTVLEPCLGSVEGKRSTGDLDKDSAHFTCTFEGTKKTNSAGTEQFALTTKGTFEGYASVFNAIDQQNDAIAPGAFTASLAKWKKEGHLPKLLWQHDPHEPIGLWDFMEEDTYGLFVRGHLLLNLPKGREAYVLLKEGVVDGLSIGFLPRKSHPEGRTRVIDQVDLYEVSLVTFMANPLAYVTSCKERVKHVANSSETKAASFGATIPLTPKVPLVECQHLRLIKGNPEEEAKKTDPDRSWTEDYRSTIQWMDRLRDLRQAMNRADKIRRDLMSAFY